LSGQSRWGAHSAFVSANDNDAKKTATALLESFGHADVIELGDITTARGSEMLLPIWLRLWGALATPMFNFKIVR
jgi:8-hydroxy-5-deazaflavin:NADPH oxidoreductase